MPDKIDDDSRNKCLRKHRGSLPIHPQIKVGFVGCGFNSKAVFYLSHDLFRFFNPSELEIHILFFWAAGSSAVYSGDNAWSELASAVIESFDHFHAVRQFQNDHLVWRGTYTKREIEISTDW